MQRIVQYNVDEGRSVPQYLRRPRSVTPSLSSLSAHTKEPRGTTKKKTGNWSTASLKSTIRVVDNGYKLREVAQHFDIPVSSLSDHVNGRTLSRKPGPGGVLSMEEESLLVEYMFKMATLGYPLTLGQLKLKVAMIV